MRIAIVGATGLVGTTMLEVLSKSKIADSITQIIPIASEKSKGKIVQFKGKEYPIVTLDEGLKLNPQVALFSAGGSVSLEYAPKFQEIGCYVIDNSSAWRMNPNNKLIVPEVNGNELTKDDYIIANPNCSTIQLVVVLKALGDVFGLNRVVVSTYQSVTGTGVKAVQQMEDERNNVYDGVKAYPHQIDKNILPHIDSFLDNGYTKEEMKVVNESRKILGIPDLKITCTAVRVPVVGGHSESVNIEFSKPFELDQIKNILSNSDGIILVDDVANNQYPMPIHSHNRDEVFVGRLRKDESMPNTLNCWIVADNLRKGAATNAVQILELMHWLI
jgi:aspartate-semialdehyde dehydrogenase